MNTDRLQSRWRKARRSIVTRMMLLSLAVVVVGVGIRLVLLRTILTEDVTALSSAHQMAIAEYAARDVENKVRLRLDLLAGLAAGIAERMGGRAGELPDWLNGQRLALSFFSEGLVLATPDGRLLATTRGRPAEPDGAWLARVAADGAADVGKPFRLDGTGAPALTFAVPVRDAGGTVAAVLAGTSAIDAENFLRALSVEKVGQTGDFLLVDPHHNLFVTAGAPERVLKPLPPPGINPLHDQAMAGYRGAGITTNIHGVEELAAIATVPTPGWFLVARTPTVEAMQPVRHLLKLVLAGSLLIPVVVLGALVTILASVLRPLTQAASQLHRMASGEMEIRALPVVRDDEVGDVAKGFNFLLGVLHDKERALLESQKQLRHLAHHDLLTGLPNRAMFEDRLEQALLRATRQDICFAVLYVDLDDFKPINDSLGHAAGDAMLRHVARQLSTAVRQSDTVARIGGDEFAILLGDLDSPASAKPVAEQCRLAASQPLVIAGTPCRVGLSIGIACHPGDGRSVGELLRHADHAMYQTKQARKAAKQDNSPA